MEGLEVLPDRPPHGVLLVRVRDERRRVALAVVERQAGDRVAPGAVGRVSETGVVRVELDELVLAAEVEKGLLRGVFDLHRGKTLS